MVDNMGYFKVYRKQENSQFWSHGAEARGVWMTILNNTNHTRGWFMGHEILPGQFATSIEHMAKDCKISFHAMRLHLKRFCTINMITCENVSNRFTKITVLNWDSYNGIQQTERQTDGKPAADHGQQYKNERMKECKKEQQITMCPAARFTPPTLEQVTEYCQQRANNVDPSKWHDFYASKGWKVGKSTMKDWQACVRTWERNQQQQHPSLPMNGTSTIDEEAEARRLLGY